MPQEVRVASEALQGWATKVFTRAGLPPEDAQTQSEVLVWANLRGVDSHGVLQIPRYLHLAESGHMNPRPNIRVTKETPAVLEIEAEHAFGPVVTKFAMERVIAKAKGVGIGWGLIRNTAHQGAMGYYALMAAREDMAGLTFVCNPPNMAPYGAIAPGVHNSPIAIAVPAKSHRPLILDMATSIVAAGKLLVAIDKGVSIPEGWALDKEGNPTTDPKLATTLVPAGSYKGSGLALMFECLSSVMVGNPLLEPVLLGTGKVPPGTQNSVVAAVNIGFFTDVEGYKEHIDNLITGLKGLPRAQGVSEILVPGEPEDRAYDERIRHGIPLPEGTVHNLQSIAQKLGIPFPPSL
jgi:LDH2 family malate/lactate/ureidoglycolate dehydrogenase